MPYISNNGLHLHYESYGKGLPLLLIHGLGSSSKDWELQIADFSRHYQVITVDLRGHGQSDKPPGPYNVSMFVDDIIYLLKSLELPSAHVVGISLGGMVALQLAVNAPEIVRSLVVVNSCPAVIPRTIVDQIKLWVRIALIQTIGIRNTTFIISKKLFPKPEQSLLRKTLIERWSTNDKRAYLHSYRSIMGWSVLDRLDAINCPTLIISGDRDYIPMNIKRECVSQIKNAELQVISDSGHATPVDQPAQFNKVLIEFLLKQS